MRELIGQNQQLSSHSPARICILQEKQNLILFGARARLSRKIATNILSARLRSLEQSGIVTRHPDPDNARQVTYELTDKGVDLIPLLIDLIVWGTKYSRDSAAPEEFVRRAIEDRDGLIADLSLELKDFRCHNKGNVDLVD